MPDLILGPIGKSCGVRAVGRNLPEIEFVVEDYGGVALGPAGRTEGRLLLDGVIGFEVSECRRNRLRDVDDCVCGGVTVQK